MREIAMDVLRQLVLALLLLAPCYGQEWVQYSSYTNDNGDTAVMLFDPGSIVMEGISVFAWTTVDDPMDRGTPQDGWCYYVEINTSRIRVVRMIDAEGKIHESGNLEWSPIHDGTTDFALYSAIVDVLRSGRGE